MNADLGAIQHAWAGAATEFAQWAYGHLVNRTDVWGGYHPIADRSRVVTLSDGTTGPLGSTITRPARSRRGQCFLTTELLKRHARATAPQDIVGLHTTSQENTCRWGAIEVDQHGEGGTTAEVNFKAIRTWYDRLRSLQFSPLLTDSNGKGGYHLLTIFQRPVPSARVFGFLRWLTSNHVACGLPVSPGTFPKQRAIESGRYGNWLRLPGRHHTREHWSRVWDGFSWLEGEKAISFILAVLGDEPSLIPGVCSAYSGRPASIPSLAVFQRVETDLSSRIRAYLAKLPLGLAEGEHRDDYAFGFAAFLVRDLALPDIDALSWLAEWDARQSVPKGEARLREILGNAKKYGHRPHGCGLHSRSTPKTVSVQVEV